MIRRRDSDEPGEVEVVMIRRKRQRRTRRKWNGMNQEEEPVVKEEVAGPSD